MRAAELIMVAATFLRRFLIASIASKACCRRNTLVLPSWMPISSRSTLSGTFIGGGAGTAAVIDFDRMPDAAGAAGLNLEADDGAFGAVLSAALLTILF